MRESATTYVRGLAEVGNGEVTRDRPQQFMFGDEQIKLLDTSRGIRNPRRHAATRLPPARQQGPTAVTTKMSGECAARCRERIAR